MSRRERQEGEMMADTNHCPACDEEVFPGEDTCGACGADLIGAGPPEIFHGRLHELILEDPLSQLNAPRPITLKGSESVARAVELMRKYRYGSVLVLDDHGNLAGIFTERDLLRRVDKRGVALERVKLETVMTPSPFALREDDTIALALNRMAVGGYRHIPLVRDGRPVGFVSIRGILRYVAQNAF
jgi:CBS domain-containing protein